MEYHTGYVHKANMAAWIFVQGSSLIGSQAEWQVWQREEKGDKEVDTTFCDSARQTSVVS